MSSRLFQEVREKRGLAYSVGSYVVGYADAGQVGVYLGTREDNLATSCEIIGAELRRIGDEPMAAEELRRAKDHLKGRLVLGMESSGTRMNRIGRAVLTGTELLTVDELVARIEAVTVDDVQALAREHWSPGHDVGGGDRPQRRGHPGRGHAPVAGARRRLDDLAPVGPLDQAELVPGEVAELRVDAVGLLRGRLRELDAARRRARRRSPGSRRTRSCRRPWPPGRPSRGRPRRWRGRRAAGPAR